MGQTHVLLFVVAAAFVFFDRKQKQRGQQKAATTQNNNNNNSIFQQQWHANTQKIARMRQNTREINRKKRRVQAAAAPDLGVARRKTNTRKRRKTKVSHFRNATQQN